MLMKGISQLSDRLQENSEPWILSAENVGLQKLGFLVSQKVGRSVYHLVGRTDGPPRPSAGTQPAAALRKLTS